MKKHFSRVAIGLLVGALLALTALDIRQAQIIEHQRDILIVMYRFIMQGCGQ